MGMRENIGKRSKVDKFFGKKFMKRGRAAQEDP